VVAAGAAILATPEGLSPDRRSRIGLGILRST